MSGPVYARVRGRSVLGPRPYPGYAALRDEVISLAYDRMRMDPLPDRHKIRKAAKRLKRAQKVEDAAKIARMWAS